MFGNKISVKIMLLYTICVIKVLTSHVRVHVIFMDPLW
jgi:hypothetical protein